MPLQLPIPLTAGAYSSRSVIANDQRCVNLYLENNPANSKPPMPTTHYPRPGKRRRWTPPVPGRARCLYKSSNDDLFAVINDTVYFIDPAYNYNIIGNIAAGTTPVSMADNGETAGDSIVLVDGTTTGYQIDMNTYIMSTIIDPTGLFQGADIVRYLQTFLMFNQPNSQNWIITQPNSVTFDALDIASKASFADKLSNIGIRMKEVWLIGDLTTEPWFLSGAADFPFEAMQSTFVPYGTVARFSVVFAGNALFWLTRNEQGEAIFMMTTGYELKHISTLALTGEIQKYAQIDDCVGQAFQMEGHTFVVFTFPTANKTWVYDVNTEQWAQWAWVDANGVLNRDRAMYFASAYGLNLALDWENGSLYQLDTEYYKDDEDAITYIRGFPHINNMLNRISHWTVRVDMDCGHQDDPNAEMAMLNMVYRDRGGPWSDPVQQPLGATGDYGNMPQFNRCGQGRDRIYEFYWTTKFKTALNAVYIDPEESES